VRRISATTIKAGRCGRRPRWRGRYRRQEWFSVAAHYPLAVIPFATSIVLVIGSPDVEPAQPRALIGGHLVTALVGPAVLKLTGPQAWAAAAAVGLSILAMYVTGTFHPPAGINPLLVVSGNLPATSLLVPVLAGVVLLTAFAVVWHRFVRRQNWPRSWLLIYDGLPSCRVKRSPSRTMLMLR
jgi:CBS-domain-containing membrane protein